METKTPQGRRHHNMRTLLVLAILMVFLVATVVLAAGIGAVHYPPLAVISAIKHGPSLKTDDPVYVTIWSLRIPRIMLAALIGGSLAIAGVAFQSLLRNDLADPYIVGVSAGASVGSEFVLLKFGESWLRGFGLPIVSFISALIAMVTVYGLARRGGKLQVTSLLLGGTVVSAFLGSISTLLLQLGDPSDAFHTLSRLMGSVQNASFGQCSLIGGLLLFSFLILISQARAMNVFSLGEEQAAQLGIEVERFKTALIAVGSILTAFTVAFAGIIGFVGLIVPHIARKLAGTPDHIRVLPIAMLAGSILLVWADTISRSVMPDGRELPIGVITAFIGAPFFCYLLRLHTGKSTI